MRDLGNHESIDEIFHFSASLPGIGWPMADLPRATTRVTDARYKPRNREAIKPAELIQVTGHHELTLYARRAITILWHNAHLQGIAEGRDYTVEIEDLKTDRHKGYDVVVDAIETLMRTILTVRLPGGRPAASSSSAETTSTIRTGPPAC